VQTQQHVLDARLIETAGGAPARSPAKAAERRCRPGWEPRPLGDDHKRWCETASRPLPWPERTGLDTPRREVAQHVDRDKIAPDGVRRNRCGLHGLRRSGGSRRCLWAGRWARATVDGISAVEGATDVGIIKVSAFRSPAKAGSTLRLGFRRPAQNKIGQAPDGAASDCAWRRWIISRSVPRTRRLRLSEAALYTSDRSSSNRFFFMKDSRRDRRADNAVFAGVSFPPRPEP